jgi:hypothetical protein
MSRHDTPIEPNKTKPDGSRNKHERETKTKNEITTDRNAEGERDRAAYLARKSSSTTAEMSRRGLPIPRSTPLAAILSAALDDGGRGKASARSEACAGEWRGLCSVREVGWRF